MAIISGCELARRARAVLLAGGRGSRLRPLTLRRAKPMVPFAGAYRLMDFSLSNCVNSGIGGISIIGQYGLGSLVEHVATWRRTAAASGVNVHLLPVAGRPPGPLSSGTADALRLYMPQLCLFESELTLVLAADHRYRMDYRTLLDFHAAHGGPVTVAAVEAPLESARAFGVLQIDCGGKVSSFEEKPQRPCPLADDPSQALASMGVYVFRSEALLDAVLEDARTEGSSHDIGRDILPRLAERGELVVFPFRGPDGGKAYWRDVGTVDSYFAAQMEMLDLRSENLLDDDGWPLGPSPADEDYQRQRHVRLGSSILSAGSRLRSQNVERSVLSPEVVVDRNASVYEAVLLPGVWVGENARIRHAIVEEGVTVPKGAVVEGGVISNPGDFRLQATGPIVSGWAAGRLSACPGRKPVRSDAKTGQLLRERVRYG